MIKVKDYLNLTVNNDINEAIRNRSTKTIRNLVNNISAKIQRTDDVATLIKLNAQLLQLSIELQIKGK